MKPKNKILQNQMKQLEKKQKAVNKAISSKEYRESWKQNWMTANNIKNAENVSNYSRGHSTYSL